MSSSIPMSKTLYSLLRMFYLNNQNDVFIDTVMNIIDSFPVADAKAWVDALILEIQSLPVLGPLQAEKTKYVVEPLQLKLQAVQDRVAVGLPTF